MVDKVKAMCWASYPQVLQIAGRGFFNKSRDINGGQSEGHVLGLIPSGIADCRTGIF